MLNLKQLLGLVGNLLRFSTSINCWDWLNIDAELQSDATEHITIINMT